MDQFNVQKVSSRGTGLYLAHSFDLGEMWWSTNPDEALEYSDLDEAIADAETHGGEVFSFGRAPLGHSAEARLEYHFPQAAE